MRARLITLWLVAHGCCVVFAAANSQNMNGIWNVELAFASGAKHSLRFEAKLDGKGTFVLTDAIAKTWGETKPSQATWTQAEGSSITFSGPMEFLVGNIGRDAGVLTFKGKFESPDLITGEVDFSPSVGDGPSKFGTFKAVRLRE